MKMRPKDYDSTVARIAGNILSGMDVRDLRHAGVSTDLLPDYVDAVAGSVRLARAIVAETRRTEPEGGS